MEPIRPIRAYVVVRTGGGVDDRVSHELPTEDAAKAFIETIRYAEGDDFEILPVG